MWKTIDIYCEECGVSTVTVDVPYGESLPDAAQCEGCGASAPRKISFNIAKQQIAERTHGGEIIGNKIVTKTTGFEETRKQLDLKKQLDTAAKKGDKQGVIDAVVELQAKKEEVKKNAGRAKK